MGRCPIARRVRPDACCLSPHRTRHNFRCCCSGILGRASPCSLRCSRPDWVALATPSSGTVQVGANAPIGHQIQQALDEATNERVKWADLSDQSIGTTRVVLLDGLDELLQASSSDRSGYLQEVADFQDAEAESERPLVVIVTSRIMVVDRVDVRRGLALSSSTPSPTTTYRTGSAAGRTPTRSPSPIAGYAR